MNAVEHDLHFVTLIDPGPETPVRFAMHLNASVGRSSQPSVVNQNARTTDACIPAHLLIDCDFNLGTFCQFNVAHGCGVLLGEWFLAQHVRMPSGSFLNNQCLLDGIDRNVDNFHLRRSQEFIHCSKYPWNGVFFPSAFRFLLVTVSNADNLEPSLPVCRKMCIVNDAAGANNPNSVIQALRQSRFVIELREDFRHLESSCEQTQRQTLAATSKKRK